MSNLAISNDGIFALEIMSQTLRPLKPFSDICQALVRFLIHLRLKFVAILVPIFLWGAFISEEPLHASFWSGFILFHLCLYGGVNALNSYYDRDEGPIGGLKQPPKVDGSLFYLAWGIQILGFVFAFALPIGFRLIYLTAMGMSLAYSHPAIRLKGSPIGSVLIVAIGQGWLTYWAGWIANRGDALSIFAGRGTLGGLAITIITVGFYPLTQIYQTEGDCTKGDLTLAVWLGVRKSFQFALVCVALAGVCMFLLFWFYFRPLEAIVLSGYFIGLWRFIYKWGHNYHPTDQMGNYHIVMRLSLANSGSFTVYLALHFLHVL